MSRIKRPSPALVVAILALVAAIAVPAYALTKKEKRVVRKISKVQANKQITKRAPGLAVASAQSADTANTANSADTAGNANTLDGQDASDFTPEGEVHSPGRVVLNDPTPGDTAGPIQQLFVSGPFTVRASCHQNSGGGVNEAATVEVLGPVGMSASAVRSDGNDQNLENGVAGFQVVLALDSANVVRSGHAALVAPSGEVLSLSASAEVNDNPLLRECVFGVTGVGP